MASAGSSSRQAAETILDSEEQVASVASSSGEEGEQEVRFRTQSDPDSQPREGIAQDMPLQTPLSYPNPYWPAAGWSSDHFLPPSKRPHFFTVEGFGQHGQPEVRGQRQQYGQHSQLEQQGHRGQPGQQRAFGSGVAEDEERGQSAAVRAEDGDRETSAAPTMASTDGSPTLRSAWPVSLRPAAQRILLDISGPQVPPQAERAMDGQHGQQHQQGEYEEQGERGQRGQHGQSSQADEQMASVASEDQPVLPFAAASDPSDEDWVSALDAALGQTWAIDLEPESAAEDEVEVILLQGQRGQPERRRARWASSVMGRGATGSEHS